MHISESSAGSYESAVSVSYINQPVLKMPIWSEGVILVLCNLTEISHETRTLDRTAKALSFTMSSNPNTIKKLSESGFDFLNLSHPEIFKIISLSREY